MIRTVIKIDLCGSKEHAAKRGDTGAQTLINLNTLIEIVREIFPDCQKSFPKGSYYRAEGDAVTMIFLDTNAALRAAVEFAKQWWSRVPSVPDCRIIVATGELLKANQRDEITGTPFQNISVAEKSATVGQIFVDDESRGRSDPALFRFVTRREFEITSRRATGFALLSYEDPRLTEDSAIVHAVFVAEARSGEARAKSYEVLALEYLMFVHGGEGSVTGFCDFIHSKECPVPDTQSLERILGDSTLVNLSTDGTLFLTAETNAKLVTWRQTYDQAKSNAIRKIAEGIGPHIGLSADAVLSSIELDRLSVEYISAVFMEVRMMATYYQSTDAFFERLGSGREFDYVIQRHLRPLQLESARQELFKRLFLHAVSDLASRDNPYIASIFHDVLMLYYMNRSEKHAAVQRSLVAGKRYFLDTNALYSLMVPASEHHQIVKFCVERLHAMQANVYVFDRSVAEYNDSLFSTLYRIENERTTGFEFVQDSPWIWQQFTVDPDRYGGDFEACVRSHLIPSNANREEQMNAGAFASYLAELGLKLHVMEPYLDREEMPEIFSEVRRAKDRRGIDGQGGYCDETDIAREHKVRHDANCIALLRCDGESPYEIDDLFITCDFRLAKIRRSRRDCSFITTIPEFAEFMMPYLLLGDDIGVDSTAVPNLLLAASLDLEFAHTTDFVQVIGGYLKAKQRTHHELNVLLSVKSRDRFRKIADKLDISHHREDRDAVNETWAEARDAVTGLVKQTANGLAASLAQDSITAKDRKIRELSEELQNTKRKLSVVEKKSKGKERYERAQKRRSKI
jgi:hypothetical protein